jgi:hypothetical protein
MKHIILTQLFLFVATLSFCQNSSSTVIKSVTKVLESGNHLKEQRNSTVEFLVNKKSKKNEIKLTIDRIMRNVKLSHVETFDSDTLRYGGEEFTVDTDSPLPKGEDDKILIENLVTFTGKPIIFKEEAGIFTGPKVRAGSPNIENMFFSKLPALNKNNFLTPLLININPTLNSKIDTVISESHHGIFITTYTKSQNGFELSGKFVPLKISTQEDNPSFASTVYELFNYSGNIKSNAEKIESLELNIHIKSRLIFKTIQLNEEKEEKYKVVIQNN